MNTSDMPGIPENIERRGHELETNDYLVQLWKPQFNELFTNIAK